MFKPLKPLIPSSPLKPLKPFKPLKPPQAPHGIFYVLIIAYPNSFRECDSRNLNINPLCSLGGGPLPKLWLEGVINWASTERFLSPALLQLIDSDINFRALQYSAP